VAGARKAAVPSPSDSNKDKPSVIIVEFIGFGGSSGDTPRDNEDDLCKANGDNCKTNGGQRTEGTGNGSIARYDTRGAIQILGAGKLSDEAKGYLTTDEQRELAGSSGGASRAAP
jgi:hypothetical protein